MMPIERLADYVTLVYHEARNVRHLTGPGHIPVAPWATLINLPRSRDEAWSTLQPLRRKAKQVESAKQVLMVFERHFNVTLDQLIALYEDQNWKHAKAYGGNAWAPIAEDVRSLATAIDGGQVDLTDQILDRLSRARHNTGTVREKLNKLDDNLRLHDSH